MAISFRYLALEGDLPQPLIPVIFLNRISSKPILVGSLVDSGAEYTAITGILAKRLELDLPERRTKMYGVGGMIDVVETTCDIILGIPSEAYKIKIPVQVFVEDDEHRFPYPLLGRTDVFDHFDISFRQRKLKIDLRRMDSSLKRVEFPG